MRTPIRAVAITSLLPSSKLELGYGPDGPIGGAIGGPCGEEGGGAGRPIWFGFGSIRGNVSKIPHRRAACRHASRA